jgi:UDP-N-acetyl-D-mannosaminuronate dehydrogenase
MMVDCKCGNLYIVAGDRDCRWEIFLPGGQIGGCWIPGPAWRLLRTRQKLNLRLILMEVAMTRR